MNVLRSGQVGLSVLAVVLGSSCLFGPAGPEVCAQAEDAVAACGITPPAGMMDRCAADPDAYEELLEASCEDIAGVIESGKADGSLFGRSWGQSCTFNLQCRDLVCRPIEAYFDLILFFDIVQVMTERRCLEPAGHGYDICEGNFCDSNSDCEGGTACESYDPLGIGYSEYHCLNGGYRAGAGECRRPYSDYEKMRADSIDVETPAGCTLGFDLPGPYRPLLHAQDSFVYQGQEEVQLEVIPAPEYDFYLAGAGISGGRVYRGDYCFDRDRNTLVFLRDELRYGNGIEDDDEHVVQVGDRLWAYYQAVSDDQPDTPPDHPGVEDPPPGCIPGHELKVRDRDGVFGQDFLNYASGQGEIQLSSTPSPGHALFLLVANGPWVAASDFCYDAGENRVVLLADPIRDTSGSPLYNGEALWVYYRPL